MNTDIIKGKWKQLKGSAQKTWGKLTEDDLSQIEGEEERLVGVVQERYGLTREAAKKQVDEWLSKQGKS
ncbi:MAG: CsbD family protein [Opitutales bacterium]|nr:CsbD family protein [Opitutales bacterium]